MSFVASTSPDPRAAERFVPDVGMVALVQIALRLRGLLLVPFLAKAFGAEGFGVWSQIQVTANIVAALSLLGLDSALIRFLPQSSSPARRRGELVLVLALVATGAVASALLLLAAAGTPLAAVLLGTSSVGLAALAAGFVIATPLGLLALQYFQALRAVRAYAVLAFIQIGLEITLLAVATARGWSLLALLSGLLAARVLMLLTALTVALRGGEIEFPSLARVREYLVFGYPMIPVGLLMWSIDSGDRYFLTYFEGVETVGIYSAAYLLASGVFLISGPICFVLFPTVAGLCHQGRQDEVRRLLRRAMELFSLLAVPLVIGLAATAPQLLALVATRDFAAGRWAAPLVAGALAVFVFFGLGEYVLAARGETKRILACYVAAAIANLVLNVLLIPVAGMLGAALATVGGYAVYAWMVSARARALVAYDFPMWSVFRQTVAGLVMWLGLHLIGLQGIASLLVLVPAGALVYFAVLGALGGLGGERGSPLSWRVVP